jgi:hypothetical protein
MSQFGKTLTQPQLKKIVGCEQSKNPLFLKQLMQELGVFGEFEKLDSRIDHYLKARSVPGQKFLRNFLC